MKQSIVLTLVMSILSGTALNLQAARHGVGLDIIRLVDKNQDRGMANIHGQIGLASDTALALGYARGDNLLILKCAIKYYFEGYFNGVFLQFGVGYYDHDKNGNDFGFVTALGYERRLNEYLALSWTMRMVAQVDEKIIGYNETPVFQPAMSIMVTF